MAKEKNKIKIRGEIKNKGKLILKRDFIYNKKINILTLNKEYKIPNNNGHNNDIILPFKSIKQNINENILSLKSISKSFEGRSVLKNVSFDLKRGQIIGLIGPNGCGKTTLLRSILGEVTLDSGEILFQGKSITSDPIHIRSRKGISYLQTHKGLFENLTAYENLYAVLELHMTDKDKIEKRIFKLLSYFGLQYLSNIKSRNFSSGESKKVACLQRMCNAKLDVLLLDEPLAALDPLSIESIKKFISEIKRINNIGVIIVEHNIRSVADILDYVFLIRDGEILSQGTIKEVSKDKNAIKYYLGSDFKL